MLCCFAHHASLPLLQLLLMVFVPFIIVSLSKP
jgi:hypothetical protein